MRDIIRRYFKNLKEALEVKEYDVDDSLLVDVYVYAHYDGWHCEEALDSIMAPALVIDVNSDHRSVIVPTFAFEKGMIMASISYSGYIRNKEETAVERILLRDGQFLAVGKKPPGSKKFPTFDLLSEW